MKNICLLVFLISTTVILGQDSYSKGFKKGYEKGYCHNRNFGCVSPIAPVAPFPRAGESSNNYSEGYNRGFARGLNGRKSKTKTVENNDNYYNGSTNGYPNSPSNNGYKRKPLKYNKPQSRINHKQIESTLNSMQAKIDYNKNLVGQTFKSIGTRKTRLYEDLNKSTISRDIKIKLYNKYDDLIDSKIESCSSLADFDSIEGTRILINCLNSVHNMLDNLEYEIKNYSISDNSKSDKDFVINFTKKKNVDYCRITRVVNIENKTIIEFEYTSPYQVDGWINISGDTHIYDATNGEKLKLIGVWNTEISPKRKDVPYNEKIRFQLTFERLKNNSKNINIIECERDSCFNFYGVSIN